MQKGTRDGRVRRFPKGVCFAFLFLRVVRFRAYEFLFRLPNHSFHTGPSVTARHSLVGLGSLGLVASFYSFAAGAVLVLLALLQPLRRPPHQLPQEGVLLSRLRHGVRIEDVRRPLLELGLRDDPVRLRLVHRPLRQIFPELSPDRLDRAQVSQTGRESSTA